MARPDGSQDPARHDRSAALRHARVQRWHGCPYTGRRLARRRRLPVRARPPAIGRVHAVAVDHHHRPAPEHPRRVDERCSPSGRRAVGRLGAQPCRLPHGDHRQAALRAISRSVRAVRRERVRPVGRVHDHAAVVRRHRPVRTVDSSISSRRRTPAPGRCTTRGGWPTPIPRRSGCSTRCSIPTSRSTRSAAATPVPRRCTTTRSPASGTTPTGWPTARSPGSTHWPPTTTGSAG